MHNDAFESMGFGVRTDVLPAIADLCRVDESNHRGFAGGLVFMLRIGSDVCGGFWYGAAMGALATL